MCDTEATKPREVNIDEVKRQVLETIDLMVKNHKISAESDKSYFISLALFKNRKNYHHAYGDEVSNDRFSLN